MRVQLGMEIRPFSTGRLPDSAEQWQRLSEMAEHICCKAEERKASLEIGNRLLQYVDEHYTDPQLSLAKLQHRGGQQ